MSNNKFYNLTNDHLFKNVFREEENMKILLKDFFGIDAIKIVYKNGETLRKNKTDKYGTIDILLELDDTVNVILEMQNKNEYNLKNRLIKYSSTITSDNGIKNNEDYSNLKSTKALAIINYNEREYIDYVEAKLKDKYNNIFSNILEFKIVNLKNYKGKKNTLYKFLTCENLEEIKMYKNDKRYKNIYKKIEYYNLDEKELRKMDRVARMLEEEKENYNDAFIAGEEIGEKKGIIIGESNGIKIGEKNGIKAEKINIAKNMLNEKFDISIISKMTSLSENELKMLQKSL